MKDEWKSFEDELPTIEPGEQVKILFCGKMWATFFVGLYTHLPDASLRERLAKYDINVDRFHDWEHTMPTHWMLAPELPKL